MLEGIGCIVTSMLGTGSGTTSYSQNVAAIQITRVASRRVSFVFSFLLITLIALSIFLFSETKHS